MHRRQSPTSIQESEMASKSLHELQAGGHNTDDPLHHLRLVCLSRGPSGILELARMFRIMDHNGHKQLNQDEFVRCLKATGLDLDSDQVVKLFKKFDYNNSGCFNMTEFINHVMPFLSESRKMIVDKAFEKVDKSGEGVVTISDLKRVYNVKSQPRYISGEESEDMILKRFLGHFEEYATRAGSVTHEEFFNYYSAVSATIENDCYFDLMMRQAYKL